MTNHFITLTCNSCGAKLEIFDEMERFGCRYCGNEMVVQRQGGAVVLRTVAEAIKKVQVGTDKTAAELAIVRLEKELAALRQEHPRVAALVKFQGPGHGNGFIDKIANAFLGRPADAPLIHLRQIEGGIALIQRRLQEQRKIADS